MRALPVTSKNCSGLRPGEKLYEELLADAETTLATPHPKLRVAKARETELAHVGAILQWITVTDGAMDDEVRQRLKEWVDEYRPANHSNIAAGV